MEQHPAALLPTLEPRFTSSFCPKVWRKPTAAAFCSNPAPSPSRPQHVGTTPAAAVPQCPLSPGSRQQRRQDRGSHRRTDVRGIFFLEHQGPGAAGRGRALSVVPGKDADCNLQSPRLLQPPATTLCAQSGWDPEMAPCPPTAPRKVRGGAAGRAGPGPESLPQPRGTGRSARCHAPALPHGSVLAARGETLGWRLGESNGREERGRSGASS